MATVPTGELTIPGKLLVCDDLSQPPFLSQSPFASYDPQGNPVGSDIEIFEGIAERLGLQLQVVNARFDPGSGNAMLMAATGGTCDMVANGDDLVAWGWRAMDWVPYLGLGAQSAPYFQSWLALYVATPKGALADGMAAALVAMVHDGTYQRILTRWDLQGDAICPQDMTPYTAFTHGFHTTCPRLATPSPSPTPTASPLGIRVVPWRPVELGTLTRSTDKDAPA